MEMTDMKQGPQTLVLGQQRIASPRTMSMRLAFLAALWAAGISGCQSTRFEASSASPPVTHVVICWLRDPGNLADRKRLIDASVRLREIPGVLSVVAGTPLPSTRPIVDKSYDVAIAMTFRDPEALAQYQKDPRHIAEVQSVLQPLTRKVVIYDFR